MKVVLLTLVGMAFAKEGPYVPLPAPFTEDCIVGKSNAYDPSKAKDVPWFNVNLDDPPETRWVEIRGLISVIKNMTFPIFGGKLIQAVDKLLPNWDEKFPEPHRSELKGLAKAAGVPLGEIVMYVIFYELNAVCTAIVAQDDKGKLYHARNLDFGLFMGWNEKTHDWRITEMLRPNIINVNWVKDGKTLYKTVQFAGYTGVYNGVKQGMFTIAANERYDIKGGFMGIIQWMLGSGSNWMTWTVRDAFETQTTYQGAVDYLKTTPLMSPVYFTVGGTKAGEATIITRSLNSVVEQTFMNETDPNGWYVLETNYDHGKPVLFLDDRRAPGNICMKKLGQSKAGFQGIFNVLSSKTNYNKLTAYTVLMQVDSGAHETYIRKCPDPCWPW